MEMSGRMDGRIPKLSMSNNRDSAIIINTTTFTGVVHPYPIEIFIVACITEHYDGALSPPPIPLYVK